MAIDDNTIYGLYGSQIKDLPEKINAVKGLAKVLTADDYNWPTNSPDGVALWNLPSGLYQGPEGSTVKVYYRNGGSATIGQNNPELELVLKNIDGSQKGMVVQLKDYTSKMYYGVDDSGWSTVNLFTTVTDNLTSTSTTVALSANQGRVLKNMIDAITGFSYEVVQTLPATGENGKIYLLPIDESGGPADNIYEEYIWVNNAWEMIGTTEMDLSDYVTNSDLATTLADYALASTVPSVVQSTGTSTTSVMSQNATTNMFYKTPNSSLSSIGIGYNTKSNIGSATEGNVVIGNSISLVDTNRNVMIGESTQGATSGSYCGTAVGTSAQATATCSVALGSYAVANTQGQFDVSTGTRTTAGYNSSNYRLLTGLYDPQSAHDAATKGYVDTEIAGISTPDTFTTNEWNALWA